jgi:hypothetical protein
MRVGEEAANEMDPQEHVLSAAPMPRVQRQTPAAKVYLSEVWQAIELMAHAP